MNTTQASISARRIPQSVGRLVASFLLLFCLSLPEPARSQQPELTAALLPAAPVVRLSAPKRVPFAGGPGIRMRVTGNGKLYVLAVGVNHYADPAIASLAFAEADASAIADLFAKRSRAAFTGIEVTTLLGNRATLANVRSAMLSLTKGAGPEDTFLFYYAGEGFQWTHSDGELNLTGYGSVNSTGYDPLGGRGSRPIAEYSFLLSDAIMQGAKARSGALSSQELAGLLYRVPAQKQIVILDSCDTKAALDAIRLELEASHGVTLEDTGRKIALLGVDGLAGENAKLGHGLLTAGLIKAMNGDADFRHTGIITEAALESYLLRELPLTAAGMGFGDENLYSYSTLRGLALTGPDMAAAAPKPEPEAIRGVTADPPQPTSADLGTDYALLVGSDNYVPGWSKLANPVSDVRAVHDRLKISYGYAETNIYQLENPTREAFLTTLAKLKARSFGPRDRLLLYFAGHGFRDESDGYLVFSDSNPQPLGMENGTILPFGLLAALIEKVPVQHTLLVLDVCYGGSFSGTGDDLKGLRLASTSTISEGDMVARSMRAKSRIYLAAGTENRTVSDGKPGEHSPFARGFLAALSQNATDARPLHIGDLFRALDLSLPLEPRAGYFYPGATETGADFLFLPRPAASSDHASLH